MKNLLRKIDKYLDKHTTLWIFIILLVILRVPNFFEPYWYGDEGIYLTIGQSIRHGQKLYTDIVDHKTPVIYYLATVPTQFHFRVLLMAWMITTTVIFYILSKTFFKKNYLVWLNLIIFVTLTTLPWLEGNIPNGELFVLGFVMVGWWLAIKSGFLQRLFATSSNELKSINKSPRLLFLSGVFYGLAILTKVPALTDLASILLIPWFILTEKILQLDKKNIKLIIEHAKSSLQKSRPLILGVILTILLSIVYFVSQGAGSDYLKFGLLYNFHYTQSWKLDLNNPLLNLLFTLPIKTLLLFAIIGLLSYLKVFSIKFKFFLGWSCLALYATLLSNRPYPHYLIQIILPLSFLTTVTVEKVVNWFKNKKNNQETLVVFLSGAGVWVITIAVLLLLNFRVYSTKNYYQNFFKFIRGDYNQQEYYQTFNLLMTDNYKVAEFLKNVQAKELFIWGTNPMLYALSNTVPQTRFTVSFHITDLKLYKETLNEVVVNQPKFIVVMNNAPAFPEFYAYLDDHYLANYEYEHMILYKRLNAQDKLLAQ